MMMMMMMMMKNAGYMTEKLNILKRLRRAVIHQPCRSHYLNGHNIEWDHFDILATGRSDVH